jgi:hypothetical protein
MNDPTPGCADSSCRPDTLALGPDCTCLTLDEAALRRELRGELDDDALHALVEERLPYLFSARPVIVSATQRDRMAAVVAAVESVIALPAYRQAVLADAPAVVAQAPTGGAAGVFMGYDFHVDGDRVGLIEINTNAGGAMLNALLARAQRDCCEPLRSMGDLADRLEADIVAMFREEWRRGGRGGALRRIAIVDEDPPGQFLYPEFVLFRKLFARHGIAAVIAAPGELAMRKGALVHADGAVDLVYNRLTDFALAAADNAAVLEAWRTGTAVVTPHPLAHALHADKRNLVLLTDDDRLRGLGVPQATRAVLLAGIPRTRPVRAGEADDLWARRGRLFFKPTAGFGGRAAYRGDKLTRGVWRRILEGGYVAQDLVAPGERRTGDAATTFRFDVRNFAYDGRVQWLAARLYRGQTTNFRTPGGGFAPVYVHEDGNGR